MSKLWTIFFILPMITWCAPSQRAKCALECYSRCMQSGTPSAVYCNCPVEKTQRTCSSVEEKLYDAEILPAVPEATTKYIDSHTIRIEMNDHPIAFAYIFEYSTISTYPDEWYFAGASMKPTVTFSVLDPCRDYQFRVIVVIRSTDPEEQFIVYRPRPIPVKLPPFALSSNEIEVENPVVHPLTNMLKIYVRWTLPTGYSDGDIHGYEAPALYPMQCRTPEEELPQPKIEIVRGGGRLAVSLPSSVLEARCRLWVEVKMLPRCVRLEPFSIQKNIDIDCDKRPDMDICSRGESNPVCTERITISGNDGKPKIDWEPPTSTAPLYYHVRYGIAHLKGAAPFSTWQLISKRDVKVEGSMNSLSIEIPQDKEYGIQVCAILSNGRKRPKFGVVPVTAFQCETCKQNETETCDECHRMEIPIVGDRNWNISSLGTASEDGPPTEKPIEQQAVLQMETDMIVAVPATIKNFSEILEEQQENDQESLIISEAELPTEIIPILPWSSEELIVSSTTPEETATTPEETSESMVPEDTVTATMTSETSQSSFNKTQIANTDQSTSEMENTVATLVLTTPMITTMSLIPMAPETPTIATPSTSLPSSIFNTTFEETDSNSALNITSPSETVVEVDVRLEHPVENTLDNEKQVIEHAPGKILEESREDEESDDGRIELTKELEESVRNLELVLAEETNETLTIAELETDAKINSQINLISDIKEAEENIKSSASTSMPEIKAETAKLNAKKHSAEEEEEEEERKRSRVEARGTKLLSAPTAIQRELSRKCMLSNGIVCEFGCESKKLCICPLSHDRLFSGACVQKRKREVSCLRKRDLNATWDPVTMNILVYSFDAIDHIRSVITADRLFVEFGKVREEKLSLNTPNETIGGFVFDGEQTHKMVVGTEKIVRSGVFSVEPFVFHVKNSIDIENYKYGMRLCTFNSRLIMNPFDHNWNDETTINKSGNIVQVTQLSAIHFTNDLRGDFLTENYWLIFFNVGKITLLLILAALVVILVFLNCSRIKALYDRKRTRYFTPYFFDPQIHVTQSSRHGNSRGLPRSDQSSFENHNRMI